MRTGLNKDNPIINERAFFKEQIINELVFRKDQKETTLLGKVSELARNFICNFKPLYVVLGSALIGGTLGSLGGPIGIAIGIILGIGLGCAALAVLSLDHETPVVDTTKNREALAKRIAEELKEHATDLA
jgi:hypothetical protein